MAYFIVLINPLQVKHKTWMLAIDIQNSDGKFQ